MVVAAELESDFSGLRTGAPPEPEASYKGHHHYLNAVEEQDCTIIDDSEYYGPTIAIIVTHHSTLHEIILPETATIADLANHTAELLDVYYPKQRFLVSGAKSSGSGVITTSKPFQGLKSLLAKGKERVAQESGDSTATSPAVTSTPKKVPTTFTYPFDSILLTTVLGDKIRQNHWCARCGGECGAVDDCGESKDAARPQKKGSHFLLFAPLNSTMSDVADREAENLRRAGVRQRRLEASKEAKRKRMRQTAAAAEARNPRTGGRNVATLSSLNESGSSSTVGQRSASELTESEAPYFQTIRPLLFLPRPDHALSYLHRLARDPGIQRAMARNSLTVGTLTELDPSANTTATHTSVSRILGMNHNAGQVIELRLRTDAYDGWRPYKLVRLTLCHELTHNRHQDHGKGFKTMCKQLEQEVDGADWWRGGGNRVAGDVDMWEPPVGGSDDEEEGDDNENCGGVVGGVYVLGGVPTDAAVEAAVANTATAGVKVPTPETSSSMVNNGQMILVKADGATTATANAGGQQAPALTEVEKRRLLMNKAIDARLKAAAMKGNGGS